MIQPRDKNLMWVKSDLCWFCIVKFMLSKSVYGEHLWRKLMDGLDLGYLVRAELTGKIWDPSSWSISELKAGHSWSYQKVTALAPGGSWLQGGPAERVSQLPNRRPSGSQLQEDPADLKTWLFAVPKRKPPRRSLFAPRRPGGRSPWRPWMRRARCNVDRGREGTGVRPIES